MKLKHKIENLFSNLKYFFNYSLPGFFIRGKRGWATQDVWSWSHYNAKINRDALKWLRKNKHGYSIIIYSKLERDLTKEETEEEQKNWDSILDEMIYAFDCIVRLDENLEFYYEKAFIDSDTIKWRLDFEKKFNTHFMTKKEYDRMRNGLRLYMKYYFDLWD